MAASCAIPGMFPAVEWDGRRYMDGGVSSGTHADWLLDAAIDVALVITPMTAKTASIGALADRCLAQELRLLSEQEIEVLCIQPESEDLAALGSNLMDAGRGACAWAAGERRGRAKAREWGRSLAMRGRGSAPARSLREKRLWKHSIGGARSGRGRPAAIASSLLALLLCAWSLACASRYPLAERFEAAAEGDVQAQYQLGLRLKYGAGLPRDLEHARAWLTGSEQWRQCAGTGGAGGLARGCASRPGGQGGGARLVSRSSASGASGGPRAVGDASLRSGPRRRMSSRTQRGRGVGRSFAGHVGDLRVGRGGRRPGSGRCAGGCPRLRGCGLRDGSLRPVSHSRAGPGSRCAGSCGGKLALEGCRGRPRGCPVATRARSAPAG